MTPHALNARHYPAFGATIMPKKEILFPKHLYLREGKKWTSSLLGHEGATQLPSPKSEDQDQGEALLESIQRFPVKTKNQQIKQPFDLPTPLQ